MQENLASEAKDVSTPQLLPTVDTYVAKGPSTFSS